MALTKDEKKQVIDELTDLLQNSKLTVAAVYQGTGVKQMQALRAQARENDTTVKVVKNRLVKRAISGVETLKDVDTSALEGQLLYAFNTNDEVAPAQVLANFAKTNPNVTFVGAITADGKFLSVEEVKDLATLPSKPELIAQVLATLSSPTGDVISALSGGLPAIVSGLETKVANE